MTRFEYDETPFSRVDPTASVTDTNVWTPKRDMVVWGMEFPELLLSETLNFHDVRVKDTANDTTQRTTTAASTPDNDYDQYRIPQGSSFIEVWAPRSPRSPQAPNSVSTSDPNLGAVSSSLYDQNGNLIIDKLAPSSSGLTMNGALLRELTMALSPCFESG